MNSHYFGWIIGVLLAIFFPILFGPAQVNMVTEIIIFSLYALSYNLLLGYGGLLSFGHSMFFGFGSYATGAFLLRFPNLPFFVLLLIATMSTTIISLAIGSFLIRQKGAPFALTTLAFSGLFYTTAIKWTRITGGDDGLVIMRPNINLGFLNLDMSNINTFYYVTLVILGSSIILCWRFTKTAMGQTTLLIRENEERMEFIGYNTAVARLILITVSGTFAGLSGFFYMLFFGTVAYNVVSVDMTATALLMTFIGGMDRFYGPILGAAFYTYVQDFLSEITDRWPFFMGSCFVLIVMFLPGGLAGLISSFVEIWQDRLRKIFKKNRND